MKRDTWLNQLQFLYEQDEHLWLTETIKLLKENRLAELDIQHLIEELEALSKRDKNRVESFFKTDNYSSFVVAILVRRI